MNLKHYVLFIFILPVFACNNRSKEVGGLGDTSINKVWEFKKLSAVKLNSRDMGAVWSKAFVLDLSNRQRLRFRYKAGKTDTLSYTYTIIGDTIFVQKKPMQVKYRIAKLTPTELVLVEALNNSKNKLPHDSVEMFFQIKQ